MKLYIRSRSASSEPRTTFGRLLTSNGAIANLSLIFVFPNLLNHQIAFPRLTLSHPLMVAETSFLTMSSCWIFLPFMYRASTTACTLSLFVSTQWNLDITVSYQALNMVSRTIQPFSYVRTWASLARWLQGLSALKLNSSFLPLYPRPFFCLNHFNFFLSSAITFRMATLSDRSFSPSSSWSVLLFEAFQIFFSSPQSRSEWQYCQIGN